MLRLFTRMGKSKHTSKPVLRSRLVCEQMGERIVPSAYYPDDPNEGITTFTGPLLPTTSTDPSDPPPDQTTTTGALLSEAAPVPPKKGFEDIKDVTDQLRKNKAAADILDAFEKAGGTVVSGDSPTGYHIEFPAKPGDKFKIVIDPTKATDVGQAAGKLLFELLRWQYQEQQNALLDQLKTGKLTPEDYALESEKLTYEYTKKHHEIAAAAVKAGDLPKSADMYASAFDGDWSTFDKFLEYEKKTGHYDLLLKNAKAITGMKPE